MAVRRAALNLKLWDPELTLSELSFKDCAFWVQIHDLSPNRMNMNNATKLGKFIGKFIKVDMETMEQQVKRFMRIRIEVNTEKCFKQGCHIDRGNGSQHWVNFKYEIFLDFYYICGIVDHTERACPIRRPGNKIEIEGDY